MSMAIALRLGLFLRLLQCANGLSGMRESTKARMKETVREMFYHAYDNYMLHAFPHDELKPVSRSYTDSLAELGNLNLEHLPESYQGSALTLLDSLSSLAVLGNASEFRRAVLWLSQHMSFDSDVRVSVFECTIRMLGGLISAHLLALGAPPGIPSWREAPSAGGGPEPQVSYSLRTRLGAQPACDEAEGWQESKKARKSGAPQGNTKRAEEPQDPLHLQQHGSLDANPWRYQSSLETPGPSAHGHSQPVSRASDPGSDSVDAASGERPEHLSSGPGSRNSSSTGALGDDAEGSVGGGSGGCASSPRVRGVTRRCRSGPLGGAPELVGDAPAAPLWTSVRGEWYQGELLVLAEDLAQRLMPAFNTPTGIPYAWVNLKHGVRRNETTETSTSGCGSLILEFGLLSRLTHKPAYEAAARRALLRLWRMRSSLDLLGTTLDVARGTWIEQSSGIGAGVDSFYEYLLKAYILFGDTLYWDMFSPAYAAVQRHFRVPRPFSWYQDANMQTGRPTYRQFTSLQAFWPGLQVLAGDVAEANSTHRQFYGVWQRFGLFPERYLYGHEAVHPTERHYPLRPELAESTYALYHATKDPFYLEVGENIVRELNKRARVNGGFASVKDVETGQLEDHQHSFFLAEMCKYLYLLFDHGDTLARMGIPNFIFSTEGHVLPVWALWHEKPPRSPQDKQQERDAVRRRAGGSSSGRGPAQRRSRGSSALDHMVCPNFHLDSGALDRSRQGRGSARAPGGDAGLLGGAPRLWRQQPESICHVLDQREDHRCALDSDCGVEAGSCRRRTCSLARFCMSLSR